MEYLALYLAYAALVKWNEYRGWCELERVLEKYPVEQEGLLVLAEVAREREAA